MAELSRDDVLKVARLSKLELPESDIEPERARLAAVLGYVERLAEVDLEGVEPLAHVGEETNRLAADEPTTEAISNERAAEMWPASYESPNADGEVERYIRVPKVLGDGGGA